MDKVLLDKIIDYYKSIGLHTYIIDNFFKDYLEGKDVQAIVWYMNKPHTGKIIELSIESGNYDLLFEFHIEGKYETPSCYKIGETIRLKAGLKDYQTWWWIINDNY